MAGTAPLGGVGAGVSTAVHAVQAQDGLAETRLPASPTQGAAALSLIENAVQASLAGEHGFDIRI